MTLSITEQIKKAKFFSTTNMDFLRSTEVYSVKWTLKNQKEEFILYTDALSVLKTL